MSEDPDIIPIPGLPGGLKRPADGLLKREFFTNDVLRAYANEMAKLGGDPVMSDEARAQSMRETLADTAPGEDVWVFGYGSLMWNPAINIRESRKARIEGYHRKFCLKLRFGRGSPEKPGLMLGLDEGGECVGVAHRVAAEDVQSELGILWQREMISGAYRPVWLDTEMDGEGDARTVTFVINRDHPRYEDAITPEEAARRIATAEGVLGSNRDYLYRMIACLDSLDLKGGPMHDLERRVRTLANEPQQGETP